MMSAADLIYQEAKKLPDHLCAEVLDLMGYLQFRYPIALELGNQAFKLAELEVFFAPYQRSLSNFRCNRDEANER